MPAGQEEKLNSSRNINTVEAVLDHVGEAARRHDPVSVETILDTIGQRSFGPVLVLIGLVILAPVVGDIPGVPTIMAVILFLLSIQLMLNRSHLWLPRWLLNRCIAADKFLRAVGHLHRPAQIIDRLIRCRLTVFIRGGAVHMVAASCMLIAIVIPPMEMIPFSANLAGAVLTLFGLALIGRDGLLALLAFALTFASAALVTYTLL